MENTDKFLFDSDVPEWFIAHGEDWVGPLKAREVMAQVKSGEVSWVHFAWRKGQKSWQRICDLETFRTTAPEEPTQGSLSRLEKQDQGGAKPEKTQSTPSRRWFLYFADTQSGPFSFSEVARFLQAGRISSRAFCWCHGMPKWKRIEAVADFKDVVVEAKLREAKLQEAKSASPKKTAPLERRASPRRPLVARIVMASADTVNIALCRDISVGGMQVLTDAVPGEKGTRLKLNISPSEGEETENDSIEPFVAEGEIVRVLEDGRGFSFRFSRLEDKARHAIERFIETH